MNGLQEYIKELNEKYNKNPKSRKKKTTRATTKKKTTKKPTTKRKTLKTREDKVNYIRSLLGDR